MGQKITQNVHFEEKIGTRKCNVRAKAVIRWIKVNPGLQWKKGRTALRETPTKLDF